jgi:hypothetical protein
LARVLVIGALAGVASPVRASDAFAPALLAPCVTTVLDGALEEPPAPSPTRTTVPPPPRPTPEQLRARITKEEIEDLIELMTKLKHPEAGPPARRIHPERLEVILDDVKALVVAMHAREASERLGSSRVRSKSARDWFNAGYSQIESCVLGRFENRGGVEAYRQSLELVKNNRAALEELMREFRKVPLPRPSRPGGGRPPASP